MFDWSDSWSVVWSFFWIFAFIAYLFALFAVISDLFRDHELNGWWKALWIVLLVFLPFFTVLAYLIARGSGMERRANRESQQAQAAVENYIRGVARQASPAEEIATAKSLVDSGTISQQEFEAIKARALA
ncbi:SHOCT domain-containing protein [Salinibacterium sp. SWN139]|uniref:SHOCT domain-containing protein n=1 Tax=Salinibacterium sp. SWN139 TaxID=2792055 RepID=UPI0018CE9862|nr:SHOCT domain-containing protein [Salinibacterium sp. SWN139]MBH0054418.1 SHOCT domain-containing protein [Salinibacterium sp. SWN139]